jgi:alkaline phosphatase D
LAVEADCVRGTRPETEDNQTRNYDKSAQPSVYWTRENEEVMLRPVLLALLFAPLALPAPPVLVIAIDGFRHDFAKKHDAPNISRFMREGATAEALIPSFPSTTFPNFHTMATGLHPERHGIVAMVFRDPAKDKAFVYKKNSRESEWYGGTPIWEVAESKGIKTATYFWPGTDAGINGKFPSFFKVYNPRATHEERVEQVSAWMRLPAPERPGLIIVYFSDVDYQGHQHGPDSQQVAEAVKKCDASFGRLVEQARAIAPDVNIVLVSDHGQSAVTRFVDVNKDADLSGCKASNEAPMTMLYCADTPRVYRELKSRARDYDVYLRGETPAHLRFRNNPRIGDIVLLPRGPYLMQALPPGDADAEPVTPTLKGMHGYDPQRNPEMGGVLSCAGPSCRKEAVVPPAQTVDVAALLARLLGFSMPVGIDGDINRVRALLR